MADNNTFILDNNLKRKVNLMKKGIDILIHGKNSVRTTESRLKHCENGCRLLLAFIISTVVAISCIVPGYFGLYPFAGNLIESPWLWGSVSVIIYLIELYIFWKGIIILYTTSQQIGIKWRGWGLVCGMIPVANIVMLFRLLSIAKKEIRFERDKLQQNKERKAQQICKTKYPILMVHGIFFRDSRLLNYWGRIPDELIQNGAQIYYGNQDSSSSTMSSAVKLARRVKEIIEKTGCEKINIIAHSKGGLDSRAAIATQGIAKYIASLTTINTPHRGCKFVDFLLKEFSEDQINELSELYNSAALTMGDDKPDFITAISELSSESSKKFNEEIRNDPGVFYQSVGSVMNSKNSGRFPLNFSYDLVKYFDGPNDGLVGSESFEWGEQFQLLKIRGHRGISHGDMIDLNRENISGFDVREFYVQLVSGLRERGF